MSLREPSCSASEAVAKEVVARGTHLLWKAVMEGMTLSSLEYLGCSWVPERLILTVPIVFK